MLVAKIVQFNFNPRSPHGERLPSHEVVKTGVKISIHAPRTGSDVVLCANLCN